MALAGLLSLAAAPQEKKPEFKGLSRLSVLAGQTHKVRLYGENFESPKVTATAGINVRLLELKTNDGEDKQRSGMSLHLEISAPANAPDGTKEITIEQGKNKLVVGIPVLSGIVKDADVGTSSQSYESATVLGGDGEGFQGYLTGDHPAYFKLDAKPGQIWEFLLVAGRAGSNLDPIVRIRNARKTTVMLSAGDQKLDRRISFTPKTTGPFYLEISDVEARGGPAFSYYLRSRRR